MPERVRQGVVGVEVSHDQEGKHKIWEKNFWLDGVNPVVSSIGGIGVNNPEGVENGAKKSLSGGNVKGKNIIYPLKPGEHGVVGKTRHMNVGSPTWLPSRRKEGIETVKGWNVSLVDRWILQKDYRGLGGRFSERLKQRKKNIPGPTAVMLNDGKKHRGRGRPMTRRRRHWLIIPYRGESDEPERQGKGSAPPGGEDHQNRE